jgi:hypothetical protein
MAQIIDLTGLPDSVADAIIETVRNLKRHYRNVAKEQLTVDPPMDLPSWPGKVIGELHRGPSTTSAEGQG